MKIFISSTSYDLYDLRSFLIKILEEKGHQVLYHESPVFPAKLGLHSHDLCLEAVKDAELLICLIDQRYGGKYCGNNFNQSAIALEVEIKKKKTAYKYQDLSITWLEVKTAYDAGIPVMTFARNKTLDEKEVRRKNQHLKSFKPAYAEKNEVFDFLDWITKQKLNNWILSFTNFIDFHTKVNIWLSEMEKSIVAGKTESDGIKKGKILILVEGQNDRAFVSFIIKKIQPTSDFLITPVYGKFSILKNFDGLVKDNIDIYDYVVVLVDSDKEDIIDESFESKFNQLKSNDKKLKLFFAVENIESWVLAGMDKTKISFEQQLWLGKKHKNRKVIHDLVEEYFDIELAKNKSKDFDAFYSFLRDISFL